MRVSEALVLSLVVLFLVPKATGLIPIVDAILGKVVDVIWESFKDPDPLKITDNFIALNQKLENTEKNLANGQKTIVDRMHQFFVEGNRNLLQTETNLLKEIQSSEERLSLKQNLSQLSTLMAQISSQETNMKYLVTHQKSLNPNTLMEFAQSITSFNSNAMQPMLDQMHLLVTGSPELYNAGLRSLLGDMARYLHSNPDHMCYNGTSAKQTLKMLYEAITMSEVKGYMMLQFSWSYRGSHSQEIQLTHERFLDRANRTLSLLDYVLASAEGAVYKCDANAQYKNSTYASLQNNVLRKEKTLTYRMQDCVDVKFQLRWSGAGSHNWKFCLSDRDDQDRRAFSSLWMEADTSSNKVITGARFALDRRVIYLQVQHGVLGPEGVVNLNTVSWVALPPYETITIAAINKPESLRPRIDLGKVNGQPGQVVTAVRISGIKEHLGLEVQMRSYDPKSGLLGSETYVYRGGGEPRQEIVLPQRPSDPATPFNGLKVNRGEGQFVHFKWSGNFRDEIPSLVPLLDLQDMVTNPPAALSGIGLLHKTFQGSGGFIAPLVITI